MEEVRVVNQHNKRHAGRRGRKRPPAVVWPDGTHERLEREARVGGAQAIQLVVRAAKPNGTEAWLTEQRFLVPQTRARCPVKVIKLEIGVQQRRLQVRRVYSAVAQVLFLLKTATGGWPRAQRGESEVRRVRGVRCKHTNFGLDKGCECQSCEMSGVDFWL